jgi:hypothetical protein
MWVIFQPKIRDFGRFFWISRRQGASLGEISGFREFLGINAVRIPISKIRLSSVLTDVIVRCHQASDNSRLVIGDS